MTRVDVFAEDAAHEAFLAPVLRRALAEHRVAGRLRIITNKGGHGRVRDELRAYESAIARGASPDLVVVGIDGNCNGHRETTAELMNTLQPAVRERSVIACPDPHIERWYLADRVAFEAVVGSRAALPRQKCGRDLYKKLLEETVLASGHPAMLGGIEFADELVAEIDWYRLSKADGAFKAFWQDLQRQLTRVSREGR